jgi:transpeptidase family protein/MecA-like transpeptidase family protein
MRFGLCLGGITMLAALTLVASACGSSDSGAPPPDAKAIATDFLNAVARGDAQVAAKYTNDPNTAQAALTAVRTALKPASVSVQIGQVTTTNTTATANYTLNWNFGADQAWSDATALKLAQDKNNHWSVTWAPSILAANLTAGEKLSRDTLSPTASTVLGSDGSTLLAPTNVTSVVVLAAQAGNLSSTAASLAGALSQFDPTISAQSIIDGANKAGASGYTVISLRDSDYQKVKAQIYSLPGVHFVASNQLLAGSRGFAGAIMPALRAYANKRTDAVSGFSVSIVDSQGNKVSDVFTKPAGTAPQLTSSLSGKAQSDMEAALNTVPEPAMAVVIQPSTGAVLAVAGNNAAVTAGVSPLFGLYPPGSTFKIATSNAAFQAGTGTPSTMVGCPGTTVIEGRTIPNENQFNLGTVPLITAFAQSCNTTFSQVAAGLSATALPKSAKQLGIGVDYTIPGFTTNTGTIKADSDTLARASDGFGQGTDLVSVFGEALMAATVAHGSTPTPYLIKGDTTQSDTRPQPIPAGVQSNLQQMMRAVVTSGTAKSIAGINPPVYGKTGTAQFGDGTHSHGWFTGYQGDLAFSILLVGGESSSPAVVVAGNFLRAYGQ